MTPCPVCHKGVLTRHCEGKDCAWRACRLCDSLVDGLTGRVAVGVSNQRKPEAPGCEEGET